MIIFVHFTGRTLMHFVTLQLCASGFAAIVSICHAMIA